MGDFLCAREDPYLVQRADIWREATVDAQCLTVYNLRRESGLT